IQDDLFALGRWLSEYYWCSLGEALEAISFIGINDVHAKMKTNVELAAPDHWLAVSREVGPDGRHLKPADQGGNHE
ncbi:MAG: hypothetical protein IIA27_13060, partial [Gemmatimonadetes bacterium]|nr:hypothetical protein [Gemmatimonadota bacterium]